MFVAQAEPDSSCDAGLVPPPAREWSAEPVNGLLALDLDWDALAAGAYEQLERIGAWERVIAYAQAMQAEEMASFVSRERTRPGVGAEQGERSACAELGLVLRTSGTAATARAHDAETLTGRYPATLAALRAGRISLVKARIIAEQTAQLSQPRAARVEARALERAGSQTPAYDLAAGPREHTWAPVGFVSSGTAQARQHAPASLTRAPRIRVQVRVTVPFSSLLGLDDAPGELAGYGPLPADVARELAAHGTWRRILTDPASGALLDYGTTVYRPPAHLAEHVIIRDQICQFPGCRTAAHRCDLDHRIPFDRENDTGPTAEHNIWPIDRRHHQIKHTPGWSVHRNPDGSTTWTTPSGHAYSTRPPPLPEPESPPDHDEPPPF